MIHGRYHEKEGFDGFAAKFLKIMDGEFAEKLASFLCIKTILIFFVF